MEHILLKKLTCSQLVKKLPTFYGTVMFITAFKRVCHLSLPWAPKTNTSLKTSKLNVIIGDYEIEFVHSCTIVRIKHYMWLIKILSEIFFRLCVLHCYWNVGVDVEEWRIKYFKLCESLVSFPTWKISCLPHSWNITNVSWNKFIFKRGLNKSIHVVWNVSFISINIGYLFSEIYWRSQFVTSVF
jgi:hypothetical protein